MKRAMGARFDAFTVRPIERQDVLTIARWLDDPKMQHALDDERTTAQQRRAFLRDLVASTPISNGRGGFVVERHGRPLGFIHLMWVNWLSRTGEVDLLVEPRFQGTSASLVVLQKAGAVAFDWYNLNKLYAFVYATNQQSLSPLRRLMCVEATLRAAAVRDGGRTDVHIVSITAARYHRLKRATRLEA